MQIAGQDRNFRWRLGSGGALALISQAAQLPGAIGDYFDWKAVDGA